MSDFAKAIAVVINTHEGSFQNRRDDPGNFTPSGELKGTKYGISAASFPDEDIANLTMARAEELYRQHYGGFAAIEDQRILTKILDLAVDMESGDHGPASRILQSAIVACGVQIAVDGIFGQQTAEACNKVSTDILLLQICKTASEHYKEIEDRNPKMFGWFNGWNSRAIWMPPEEVNS